jgi:hypothetical protein
MHVLMHGEQRRTIFCKMPPRVSADASIDGDVDARKEESMPRCIFCVIIFLLPLAARAEAPATLEEIKSVLKQLDVNLAVTKRPAWRKLTEGSITVQLIPQTDLNGPAVVSFAIPFPPDALTETLGPTITVTGPAGEIAAYSREIVRWHIDGKDLGTRSALVQFEMTFKDKSPQEVTVAWNKKRAKFLSKGWDVAQTQFKRHVDPPGGFKNATPFDYQCPKVLAVLPAKWLCESLVAWQQVPASENKSAPWFDEHLNKNFDGSLKFISATTAAFEAHLFDRPAVYAKCYVRSGSEKHLLAALSANDFYRQHITADGFFDLKPEKDLKYVYSEGTAIMYMLTGDENYKTALERVAKGWETHRGIEYAGKGFWTERHHGFGMMAWLHLYELTGNAKYLDNAKRYFNAALDMQVHPADGKAPDGAWVHTADSHGDGNGWTSSPWMSCFLTDAIWKYWMLSGDERAPASLAMYAKFAAKNAITPNGKFMYYMANSSARGKSETDDDVAHNMEAIYLMAMGHYLSGGADKDFAPKIETLKPGLLEDGANSPGRKFNWRFRETSMLIWYFANTPK